MATTVASLPPFETPTASVAHSDVPVPQAVPVPKADEIRDDLSASSFSTAYNEGSTAMAIAASYGRRLGPVLAARLTDAEQEVHIETQNAHDRTSIADELYRSALSHAEMQGAHDLCPCPDLPTSIADDYRSAFWSRLRATLGDESLRLRTPELCIFGSQNVGKSATLSHLMGGGYNLFPSDGSGLCTTCPIEVRMLHSPELAAAEGDVYYPGREPLYRLDVATLRATIEAAMRELGGVEISSSALVIEFRAACASLALRPPSGPNLASPKLPARLAEMSST